MTLNSGEIACATKSERPADELTSSEIVITSRILEGLRRVGGLVEPLGRLRLRWLLLRVSRQFPLTAEFQ
jgi:hypothetical protein